MIPSLRPDDCPFCRRISEGSVTYVTPFVVSFAPLNPVTVGHRLFVPRDHVEHPSPQRLRDGMVEAERHAGVRGEDYNLITSSGPAATMTIPHIHVHYVPRRPDDGLPLPWTPQQEGRSAS